MRKAGWWITVLFFFLSAGCKEVVDFYIGVPLQPAIDERDFVAGLNIFGIIRPDSTGNFNHSWIMLQKVIPAVGSGDSLDIGPAFVRVERLNDGPLLYDFLFTDDNPVFSQEGYRPGAGFSPRAGDRFAVECTYREWPVLTGETVVPDPPSIRMNTLAETGNSLSFEVEADTTIFMLDIYVYAEGRLAGYQRLPGERTAHTLVVFPSLQGPADSIDLYGYDHNMADYYMTANTSLNFNKYRESFGSVTNGYGVFGSLNHTRFYLR